MLKPNCLCPPRYCITCSKRAWAAALISPLTLMCLNHVDSELADWRQTACAILASLTILHYGCKYDDEPLLCHLIWHVFPQSLFMKHLALERENRAELKRMSACVWGNVSLTAECEQNANLMQEKVTLSADVLKQTSSQLCFSLSTLPSKQCCLNLMDCKMRSHVKALLQLQFFPPPPLKTYIAVIVLY